MAATAFEIRTRADVIQALHEAAELEHGLLLQYLYAALSLKTTTDEAVTPAQAEVLRGWKRSMLAVAREEMAHLGTVCNLLTAVGGTPHFARPHFPVASRYFPTADPARPDAPPTFVEFSLDPLSERTIDRFIRFEAPEPELAAAVDLRYRTIGDLYTQLAEAIAGFDELELFVGPQAAQDEDEWGISLRLLVVRDALSARRAIDSIVVEGEGTKVGGPQSHFQRFVQIRDELRAAGPDFAPARPVVSNPATRLHFEAGATTMLTDPLARGVSDVLNQTYEAMLAMLALYYAFGGEPPELRDALRRTIASMMSAIVRPLAEVLTLLPAGEEAPGLNAGPTFELSAPPRVPSQPRLGWLLAAERLRDAAEAAGEVAAAKGAPPRLAFVAGNLRLAAGNVARYRKRLEAVR
jgi:hypothetical protein